MSTGDVIRRVTRAYWFRCALVSLAAALLVASLFAATGQAPLSVMLPRSLVHASIMGGLVGSILPLVAHRVSGAGAVRAWSAVIVTLLGLAVTGSGLACVILGFADPHHPHETFLGCFARAFRVNAILSLALGVGMGIYELQRERVDELTQALHARELEHERERKTALAARLSSLESRLHPHFLFNTLNAISELIHENPDRAERTVERLAALLRASLDATERGLVPLARELELVSDYLEIEKARLGERLSYTVAVAPGLTACAVPPLAVQTLVENSIKHAIAPRPGGGRVRVDALATDGRLIVGVWDDGPGFAAEAMRAGHGLENLQGRLAARFGDAAALSVARQDGGTLVTIALPRTTGV